LKQFLTAIKRRIAGFFTGQFVKPAKAADRTNGSIRQAEPDTGLAGSLAAESPGYAGVSSGPGQDALSDVPRHFITLSGHNARIVVGVGYLPPTKGLIVFLNLCADKAIIRNN